MTPERDTSTSDAPPRAEAARRLPPVLWLLAVAGVVLVASALAAIVFAGPAEAIAVVAVGFAAMAAASLWIATTRAERRAGAMDDRDHPLTGVDADDARPLGDTPEAHDEITPHDLPAGHPSRGAAERQAQALGGTTPGHREGGATPPRADPLDELVDDDERDGARGDRGRG
jgi:hypothetical protein